MKKILLLLPLCFLLTTVSAQDYSTAFGIRAGVPTGLTFKQSIGGDAALEFILGSRWGGLTLTGLYEKHVNAFDVDGLYWFYGAGAHVGFYDRGWGWGWGWGRDWGTYNGLALGVDGILGIEYQIQEIPFTVGLDFKPAFSIVPTRFLIGEGALSLRYVF